MNLSFVNGTARQQDWVKEAVSQCSYPLGKLDVDVSVAWADQLPPNDAGKLHAYMVTTKRGAGSFLVTIASWADDPGRNPGLPDPQHDTFDFYKSSFIHELGHVVAMSTFAITDAAADVANVCSLFWTAVTSDGSPRRRGGVSDWDANNLTWPQEIREAFAEVFKVTFYKGRQVFLNRTQWNIDKDDFQSLLSYIPKADPGGIAPITYDDRFLADDLASGYELRAQLGSFVATIGGGSFTASHGVATVYSKQMPLFWAPGDPGRAWYSIIKIESLAVRDLGGGNSVVLPPQVGFGDLAGDLGGISSGLTGDQFPYWLRWWEDPSIHQVHIEGWNTDPDLGGAPVASSHFANIDNPAQPVPIMQVYAEGGVGDELDTVIEPVTGVFRISEWRVHTFIDLPPKEPPSAAYPFGDPAGEILPGPAAQGTLLIGSAR